jgi:hypothetical protein
MQSLLTDLKRAAAEPGIELHHIYIGAFAGLAFNDFDHIDEMIAAGKVTTDSYLAHPQPRLIARPERGSAPSPVIAGAREYLPPTAR